jgi:hypothetical protein
MTGRGRGKGNRGGMVGGYGERGGEVEGRGRRIKGRGRERGPKDCDARYLGHNMTAVKSSGNPETKHSCTLKPRQTTLKHAVEY